MVFHHFRARFASKWNGRYPHTYHLHMRSAWIAYTSYSKNQSPAIGSSPPIHYFDLISWFKKYFLRRKKTNNCLVQSARSKKERAFLCYQPITFVRYRPLGSLNLLITILSPSSREGYHLPQIALIQPQSLLSHNSLWHTPVLQGKSF